MALFEAGWRRRSLCATNPDALFVKGAAQNAEKRLCERCFVKIECLADALDSGRDHGVAGGMTDRERRALRKRHPKISSWRQFFERTLSSPTALESGKSRAATHFGSAAVRATNVTAPPEIQIPAQRDGHDDPQEQVVVIEAQIPADQKAQYTGILEPSVIVDQNYLSY